MKNRENHSRQSGHFKICQMALSLGKGGSERSCAILSQMLEAQGHEVHTVILTNEIDYPYAGMLFNLGETKDENDSMIGRFLRFKKLRAYLKDQGFDVIIDHRPKNNYARELFYDQYLYRKIKRIYMVHSSLRWNYFTHKPFKMAKIYNKNLVNVAVSSYIKEEIMHQYGIRKARVIHNAIDLQEVPSSKNTADLPPDLEDKTYLLWYGRVVDTIKNISFLLNAFDRSEVWKKNIRLVIMGDGKDKASLMQLASELASADYIVFLPFHSDPFPLISNARAVTLTSNYEGFPMVLVESLSLGTPVVSLDIVSGPSEIIAHRKNGLLIAGKNVESFAEGLREICFDQELYAVCKKNAKPSAKDFSTAVIARKWDQLLRELL